MEPTTTIPACRQDGAATRLACAGCGAPICPRCMSRTAVGFKCPECTGGADRPGRSRPRRGVLGAVATAAVAAVVVAALVLRAGGGEAPDPVGTPARAESAPAGQPVIGEEANDGQIVFVVTDVACGEKEIAGRMAEGKFCRMSFSARNRSGGPATLLGRFQYLLDGRSKTYGPDLALSQTLAGNAARNELTINPDITVNMVLVYDVPDTLDPLEAQLRGTGASRIGVRVRLQRPAQS